ncbi:hypothetical protein G6F35_012633 [Rhizopus arrhizus]|nr:hypothetical protein G6F35_012633 [Rhizopus arrhizus]
MRVGRWHRLVADLPLRAPAGQRDRGRTGSRRPYARQDDVGARDPADRHRSAGLATGPRSRAPRSGRAGGQPAIDAAAPAARSASADRGLRRGRGPGRRLQRAAGRRALRAGSAARHFRVARRHRRAGCQLHWRRRGLDGPGRRDPVRPARHDGQRGAYRVVGAGGPGIRPCGLWLRPADVGRPAPCRARLAAARGGAHQLHPYRLPGHRAAGAAGQRQGRRPIGLQQ